MQKRLPPFLELMRQSKENNIYYYYINSTFRISKSKFDEGGQEINRMRYIAGNIFLKKSEAILALKTLKLILEFYKLTSNTKGKV